MFKHQLSIFIRIFISMWRVSSNLLLFASLSMTEAAIIGLARLDGGSMLEIKQKTIKDQNITIMGNIDIQGDGNYEVQLIKLPEGGCKGLETIKNLEILGVLAETDDAAEVQSRIILINETIQLKRQIAFPFSGAFGVFIRSCGLSEIGMDCSSVDLLECAELNWMEEISISNYHGAEWGAWTS